MSAYLRVLRHRDFRLLFLGQSASAVGDQVVLVTLALFITRRTGSATDLGLVFAAQTIPLVGLILFGGVWADRLPRHRIMIVCDLARAALHAVFAILIFAGTIQVWQMIVLEALFGASRAFFQPAYTGLMPQTVPEDQIQDAQALSGSTANLAVMVGPALATALVLGVGAWEAFALDAATFVLSAILLSKVHPRRRSVEAKPEARPSVLADLRGGWREVRSRQWVWAIIAVFSGVMVCSYAAWYVLAPLVAKDHYGGTGAFGVLEAVAGVGSVLAALIGVVWRPTRPLRAGVLLILMWPVGNILFALSAPLALVIVVVLCGGFGAGLFLIWWETALAQYVPASALSRVSAYDWMGALALLPVGFILAGPLASVAGAQTVLGVGGVLGMALLALSLASPSVRHLGAEPPSSGLGAGLSDGLPEELAGQVGVGVGREA